MDEGDYRYYQYWEGDGKGSILGKVGDGERGKRGEEGKSC